MVFLFSSTLKSLTSRIKRSLHKHTFLSLSAYSAIHVHRARWDIRMGRPDSTLRDALGAIRAVCLRSFPEFLADIKLAAVGKAPQGETTALADFTLNV